VSTDAVGTKTAFWEHGMSMSSPAVSIGWREQLTPHDWDERVALEVEHQALIEAALDRAEAYGLLGNFADALEWLERSSVLSGGLSPAYAEQRANFARRLERGIR
jgi:hypothetical protein